MEMLYATITCPVLTTIRRLKSCLLLSFMFCLPVVVQAQTTVDRIVATVNNQIITQSDLMWQLALQPGTAINDPSDEVFSAVLERLIDQRLVAQEADKLPSVQPTDEEIRAEETELVTRFSSRAELEARMREVGLTAEQLREILRVRVEIEKFLNFRFRSFTVITPQEVEEYYKGVYVPRFRQFSPGAIVPTLDSKRETLEADLTNIKVAADTDAFLEAARAEAEIVRLYNFS